MRMNSQNLIFFENCRENLVFFLIFYGNIVKNISVGKNWMIFLKFIYFEFSMQKNGNETNIFWLFDVRKFIFTVVVFSLQYLYN